MPLSAPPATGSVWINTPPHSWKDLAGVPTVLGFWTLGCDGSSVVLRRLERLQREFGANVQVIAVHSPRTDAARSVERVANHVHRMKLSLPVLHDADLETFSRYSPGGWPACVFIDPKQNVKGVVLGSDSDLMTDIVTHLGADRSKEAPRFKVGFQPPHRATELSWPSGVTVLDTPGVIAVSDEGHDRVLFGIVDPDTDTLSVTAMVDNLNRPGKLAALPGGVVVVCQPDDGTVSLLDPSTRTIHPLAVNLVRPVGVCLDMDGSIVVADAGVDQLLRITAESVENRTVGTPKVIAGSGFTGQNDGAAGRASLSQPNAVCRTTTGVLFADAGSNNIRLLTDKGRIHSVTNNDPTTVGLTDGPIHAALLHRPVDIAGAPDGSLVIVDQLNDRIRTLENGKLATLGAKGFADPEAAAVMPDGSILVADTSNHRIVRIDTQKRTASSLRIEGVERTMSLGAAPTVRGNAGMALTLGYPSPGDGPWEVEVTAEPAELLAAPLRVKRNDASGEVVVNLGAAGQGILTVTSTSVGIERSIRLPLEVR